MTGYKVFNSDWTCGDFQYEVGKIYEIKEKPIYGVRGFHFNKNLLNCFNSYTFDSDNKVAVVEVLGDVDDIYGNACTNKIHIVRELKWHEVLEKVNLGQANTGYGNVGNDNSGGHNVGYDNSGDYNVGEYNSGNNNVGDANSGWGNIGNYNIGSSNVGNSNEGRSNVGAHNSGNCNIFDYNSGSHNIGNRNSGNYNIGNYNAGNYNIGNYNAGSYNVGCFNTLPNRMMMFNKMSNWTTEDWNHSRARVILNSIPFKNVRWVKADNMTDKEKALYPEYKLKGGYFKEFEASKEDKQMWWDNLSDYDKEEVLNIPNFDADIFEEITGIKVNLDKPNL